MSGWRLPEGGEIDRSRPLAFTFDGHEVTGFAGDTLASALMGSGRMVLGRSFKYRRPRGLWGAGVEEPNVFLDLEGGAGDTGYASGRRATTEPLRDGLVSRAATAHPSAEQDRTAFFDRFARFIPSGFYYKTFIWPDWHLFEPQIRAQAGIGTLRPDQERGAPAAQVNGHCDLLVVGGGPVGLAAALLAAEAGAQVVLVDEQDRPGGSLLHRAARIDGLPGADWLARTLARLTELGVRLMPATTAFGLYDHGLAGLNQRHSDGRPDTLWHLRPRHTLLATGAIERPLPFADNDLPGVLSAEAALIYLRRYAVVPGRRVVIASNNNRSGELAAALQEAGVTEVTLVACAEGVEAPPGVRLIRSQVTQARGHRAVCGVVLADGTALDCDALLVSGGFTPTIHLYAQARGKLAWDAAQAAFVPGSEVAGLAVAGAAAGHFALDAALAALPGVLAPLGRSLPAAPGVEPQAPFRITPLWPEAGAKGRVWIDLQHDVTAKDVELARRENFTSVEHLKRYTTLGMATDQGKTSNLNGLALMAALSGRSVPEVGTTTYRPPYTPIPFVSLAGPRQATRMNPLRRLTLEPSHRAEGAQFRDYGGWLRPSAYGEGEAEALAQLEAKRARETAALFDGSTLGKIEVAGPQAAEFLDFIYYNAMAGLAPGRCRYGFVLAETGVIFDDGVLVRLAEDRFVVSCSSSHVAGMRALLEEWRQDRFDPARVFIHDATTHGATLTVSGPRARAILQAAGVEADLSDKALPHMGWAWGRFAGQSLRLTRVSFTGDRSYELTIRTSAAAALWAALRRAGTAEGAVLLGMEALMILRAEKGYLVIGRDTDGVTMPQDLGLTGPLERKQREFLGRRALILPAAQAKDRKQFVGIEVPPGDPPLPTGAHGVDLSGAGPGARSGGGLRSLGYVTSSYASPTLGRPIALGLIEAGLSRLGETVTFQHMGARRQGKLVAPCALDPKGERLHV